MARRVFRTKSGVRYVVGLLDLFIFSALLLLRREGGFTLPLGYDGKYSLRARR